MRHPCHDQPTASPQPEPADTTADDIADVVSLDSWRLRASAAPARSPQAGSPQAVADARAAHPAHIWAASRNSGIRAATPS
jgi:hypothetical protein